jgi:hypothetical protein
MGILMLAMLALLAVRGERKTKLGIRNFPEKKRGGETSSPPLDIPKDQAPLPFLVRTYLRS